MRNRTNVKISIDRKLKTDTITAMSQKKKQHPADLPCNRRVKRSDYLNHRWDDEGKETAKDRQRYGQGLDMRQPDSGKYRPGLLR